jgi:molybdopterin synthase sulfur carrier subunit
MLRRWVRGASEVRVFAVAEAGDPRPTLASALEALRRTHPRLEERLRDEYGRIRRHINMLVCGEDTQRLGGLECALPPGAEVFVLPALLLP